jgi:hypothetical protein
LRTHPSRAEALLLAAVLLLTAVALFGPALAQPGPVHDFADGRALWGVPHALDVLSNLPFALAGLAGLWWLSGAQLLRAQALTAGLFFAGLLATFAGSSIYHWAPDDAGLALDRHGMALAFAGLLGLLAATTVSARAGLALAAALVVLGPASVHAWSLTGNVLPWALVQFGGMALVLALAWAHRLPGLDVRWGWVIAAYALAKLFELGDHVVFEATGQWLSGHTLKHLTAAAAAWPVLAALRALPRRRQNGATLAATPLARG